VIPLVPDTGVLVKFIVKEEDSPKAVALLGAAIEGTYHLAAPDFMAIEFGNVLWKYVRRAVIKETEARRHIERFPFDRIEWLPARLLLKDAFRFAQEHDVAVYDGAFLAAAAAFGADLVTADDSLHRKVRDRLPWVKLLRDYDGPSGSHLVRSRPS
jgi:predicted nucleic acid-binding protein